MSFFVDACNVLGKNMETCLIHRDKIEMKSGIRHKDGGLSARNSQPATR